MSERTIKYLNVNEAIINAIFNLKGEEDEVRKGLNKLLEDNGNKVVRKAAKKAKKKSEKTFDIASEVSVSPKRKTYKKIFKNKDYGK